MNKKNNNVLIIFVKAPRLGTVKTRLQPELTAEQSLQLYQAMVEDLVHQFDGAGFCDLKIFFHPTDACKEMKNWLGDGLEYFPQHGDDLGEKMHHAIAEMLNQKNKKVALIGSDIPTLDSATLVRAFTSLDEYDVVIGSCKDGGYYLIGMKQAYPVLFEGITWSSNLVFQQTIQNARSAAIEVVQLEKKSDIDTYHDVVDLWNYVKKRNMKGAFSFKSKTYEVLKTFFEMKNTASQ
ncbi:MAG: TIGR04282 family arsenosugar biosynthesis glycosyltransferase [bacterium]|nr:TIGR04282 family arsenosugar biosynthesis glycosyltransferase [bacterium]